MYAIYFMGSIYLTISCLMLFFSRWEDFFLWPLILCKARPWAAIAKRAREIWKQ